MDNIRRTQKEIQDLVLKAKDGDKQALEEIYASFKGFIYNISFSIYLKNYELQDLLQIGNESIGKALEKYNLDNGRPFVPYVLTAIKKNFNNLIRKNSRYGYESSLNVANKDGLEIINIISSSENIEENLLKKEIHIKLKEIINKLDEEEKEIIEYIYIRGYRVVDFANLKKLDYWVCQRKIKALLKRLRQLLEK